MSRTRRRSPEVRSTAFTARPPDLPPRSLMAVDFAITCSLVRPGRPRYPVLVHRAAALLHASFRPRLATTPLRFTNPSPPSGWIGDVHPGAVEHARHTRKSPPSFDGGPSKFSASDLPLPIGRGAHTGAVQHSGPCTRASWRDAIAVASCRKRSRLTPMQARIPVYRVLSTGIHVRNS